MPELIRQIVNLGIEVTIKKCHHKTCKDTIIYDLDTQAKSHLYLKHVEGNKWLAHMRYDEIQVLNNPTLEDIVDLVKYCTHYRDFVNYRWKLLF